MKHLFLLLILLSTLFSEEKVDPYKNIQFYTLENGLKVYLLKDKKSTNTSIQVDVGAGSILEDTKNVGITHLVEHLVFRDKRVPHRDFYDYMIDEGADSVNGRTKAKTTEYTATINSAKSYWITETFAQMLFDKKVDNTDLKIERNALQTEIGEANFISYLSILFKKLEDLYPKEYNFYETDFNLKNEKDEIDRYYSQINNKKFSLDDILKYYDSYYYPANMTLKIAGNFELEKMKKTIANSFGKIERKGSLTATILEKEAKLNDKPYLHMEIGASNKNYAYIGVKFIDQKYKNFIVLDSYVNFLEKKIQRALRNSQGETYSVNNFYFKRKDAAIIGIGFDSLHSEFDKNTLFVKNTIFKNESISDIEVEKALKDYELLFLNQEHDADTLQNLIGDLESINYLDKNFTQTPYEIFKSIKNKDYIKTINNTFTKENMYQYIYKDYYFFPYDRVIINIIYLILFILIYFKYSEFVLKRKGIFYTNREILFSRHIGNRFLSFIVFVICFIIADIITEWIEYFSSKFILGNQNYFNTLDGISIYTHDFISIILFIIIFLLILSTLFKRNISKIDVLENKLNFFGSRLISINKNEIDKIEEVNWSLNNFFKTYGYSILFLKKLVLIKTLKNGEFYIRVKESHHLVEDLKAWHLK